MLRERTTAVATCTAKMQSMSCVGTRQLAQAVCTLAGNTCSSVITTKNVFSPAFCSTYLCNLCAVVNESCCCAQLQKNGLLGLALQPAAGGVYGLQNKKALLQAAQSLLEYARYSRLVLPRCCFMDVPEWRRFGSMAALQAK